MRRYFLSSAIFHFSILGLFLALSFFSGPPDVIWFDGIGFDLEGGGGGGSGGDGRPKAQSLKEEKRGQPVPNPVQTPVPSKPAPVQKAVAADEAWKIKGEKEKTPVPNKVQEEPLERGEKAQKEQTNIVRRGVADGSKPGEGEFDFGATGSGSGGEGEGDGKGVGIGFGPGEGGGFGFGGYLAIMRKKIWAEWTQYATLGSDKSCVVGLTVLKSGEVLKIDLERSSGDAFFDGIARKAVRNASPLPPLPPGFPRDEQRFRIQFKLID